MEWRDYNPEEDKRKMMDDRKNLRFTDSEIKSDLNAHR